VALTRAPENVGENHDISFEAPLTLRLTGVGGRGAGGESTSPKLLIWWKSGQNMWKFMQNVWLPSQNRCICFDFAKKCRPSSFIGGHIFN